jgi:lipopolysaccharide transport system ATP-binding protein
MPAIEFSHASKEFAHGGRQLLARLVAEQLFGLRHERRANTFQALHDISFTVEQGEAVGIIGSNGAGKSTLLALASGVTEPDSGTVRVEGTLAPLLDLGAGFHPDLSGEENLRLNASLLGLNREQVERIAPAVADFAGLGDFLRDPVRVYSSGMLMRLAFSIAVHLDPAVFIIDEIIGVGDAAFQEKCRLKMLEFRQRRKTLLVASHSPALILSLCDKAIWLEKGVIRRFGTAEEVMTDYQTPRPPNA